MPKRPTYEISVIERDFGSTVIRNTFDAVLVAAGGAVEEIQEFEREFLKAADFYTRNRVSQGDRLLRSAREHARLARIYAGLAAYANRINHLATSLKGNSSSDKNAIDEIHKLHQNFHTFHPGMDLDAWENLTAQVLNDPSFRQYDRTSLAAREFEKCLLEVDESMQRVARLSKNFDGLSSRSQALNDSEDATELSNGTHIALILGGILTAYFFEG